jgi:hypothetical protein
MKTRLIALALATLILGAPPLAGAEGFVRTRGQDFIGEGFAILENTKLENCVFQEHVSKAILPPAGKPSK